MTVDTSEPRFQLALKQAVTALRRLAEYELEPPMARRLQQLSENKEFLNEEEYEELLSLVDFSRRRTIEKLEAQLTLKQLNEVVPELLVAS